MELKINNIDLRLKRVEKICDSLVPLNEIYEAIQDINTKILHLEKMYDIIGDKLDNLEKKYGEIELNMNSKIDNVYSMIDKKNSAIMGDIASVKSENNKLSSFVNTIKNQYETVTTENNRLSSFINTVMLKNSELLDYVDTIRSQYETVTTENNKLSEFIDTMMSKHSELSKYTDTIKNQYNTMMTDMANVCLENNRLKQQITNQPNSSKYLVEIANEKKMIHDAFVRNINDRIKSQCHCSRNDEKSNFYSRDFMESIVSHYKYISWPCITCHIIMLEECYKLDLFQRPVMKYLLCERDVTVLNWWTSKYRKELKLDANDESETCHINDFLCTYVSVDDNIRIWWKKSGLYTDDILVGNILVYFKTRDEKEFTLVKGHQMGPGFRGRLSKLKICSSSDRSLDITYMDDSTESRKQMFYVRLIEDEKHSFSELCCGYKRKGKLCSKLHLYDLLDEYKEKIYNKINSKMNE